MDLKEKFVERLNDLIEKKQDIDFRKNPKTQAQEMDVPYTTFQKYYSGISLPGSEILCKLADYYKVSTDYLLGRTDARSPDTSVRAVAESTGLSEEAILTLETLKNRNNETGHTNILSLLLEYPDFDAILEAYALLISDRHGKLEMLCKGSVLSVLDESDVSRAVLQYQTLKSVDFIRESYEKRFGKAPHSSND